jgi:hypothetical protein
MAQMAQMNTDKFLFYSLWKSVSSVDLIRLRLFVVELLRLGRTNRELISGPRDLIAVEVDFQQFFAFN